MQLLKIHDNAKFGGIFEKVFFWIMNQGGISFVLREVEGQNNFCIDFTLEIRKINNNVLIDLDFNIREATVCAL